MGFCIEISIFVNEIQILTSKQRKNVWNLRGRGISPYGQISLQSGATSPTISNQVAISPTKHRLRLHISYHFLFYKAERNHNGSKPLARTLLGSRADLGYLIEVGLG